MPAFLAARLYRILPLLIILAILAAAIYLVVSWRSTPARAKEIVIKIFIVLNAGLSLFFLLATLYALLEGNIFIVEFFATLMATTLVALGITFICRAKFLKHNPNYRWRITDKAEKKDR